MKWGSLFSGIGGFDLALTRKGHEIVWACEIDEYARKIYEKNFKPTWPFYADARRIEPEKLPDFDGLCAGFPCQSFSIAGKRKGFEDCRGTLFFEITRIASVKRPEFLLLENVFGLLSNNNGQTFGTILSILSKLGYICEWQILNSKGFGVPQSRERVFIVGHLGRISSRTIFPIGENCKTDYVVSTITTRYWEGQANGAYLREISPKGNSQGQRVYSPSGLAVSLSSGIGGQGRQTGLYQMDDGRIRRLTPLEVERCFGFPDGWTEGISDARRYKCLGNAVVVPVIEAITKRIKGKVKI